MPKAKINGTEIFYRLDGEGQEILLILNGIMMSTASWEAVIPDYINAGYQVMRVDFRDQGESGSSAAPYTIEQHSDDLKALLDYLGIAKCHILGISYGGQVAMIFALHYGEYINKLILANTTARLHNHLKAIGRSWDEAARLNDGLLFFKLAMPTIYSGKFYESHYEWLLEREKTLGPALDEEWFTRYLRLSSSHGAYDIRGDVKNIRVPTLLIAGTEDAITPYVEMRKIYEAIPDSYMLLLPECGHTSCYEKTAEFNMCVIGFLKNQRRPRP